MICLMLYTTGCFGAQELGLFCPRAMEVHVAENNLFSGHRNFPVLLCP